MASTIFRLDSRVFSTWSVKNCLQLLHDSLRSRLRGTIQRQVISTSTVFSTLIRVKSRNGPEMGYPFCLRGIIHVDGNVLHRYHLPMRQRRWLPTQIRIWRCTSSFAHPFCAEGKGGIPIVYLPVSARFPV